jgi:hypothetical protein
LVVFLSSSLFLICKRSLLSQEAQWVRQRITSCYFNYNHQLCVYRMYGYVAAGYTTLGCYRLGNNDYFAMRRVSGESVFDISFYCFFSVIVIIVVSYGPMLFSFNILR